jgi:hypothetical protein
MQIYSILTCSEYLCNEDDCAGPARVVSIESLLKMIHDHLKSHSRLEKRWQTKQQANVEDDHGPTDDAYYDRRKERVNTNSAERALMSMVRDSSQARPKD